MTILDLDHTGDCPQCRRQRIIQRRRRWEDWMGLAVYAAALGMLTAFIHLALGVVR